MTGLPSTIKDIVNIPLKRPRNFDLRYTNQFIELRKTFQNMIETNQK